MFSAKRRGIAMQNNVVINEKRGKTKEFWTCDACPNAKKGDFTGAVSHPPGWFTCGTIYISIQLKHIQCVYKFIKCIVISYHINTHYIIQYISYYICISYHNIYIYIYHASYLHIYIYILLQISCTIVLLYIALHYVTLSNIIWYHTLYHIILSNIYIIPYHVMICHIMFYCIR